MEKILGLVYVHVLIALLACNVLSQRQGDVSVGAVTKLGFFQKVLAKFWGCEPLNTASATVTCTAKNKEVDCNIKLPIGAKATFRCDYDFYLTKSYNTTECKRGKKWDPQPPTCQPETHPEAAEAIAFAETSTEATQPTAATIPTTTTKFVRETHVNPFPTTPMKLPIKVKTYEGVGTLSLPTIPPALEGKKIDFLSAKKVCKYNNANLMYLDTPLARDAAESMMILSHTNKGIWLDSTYDTSTKKFYSTPGVEVNPGMYCAGEPTNLLGMETAIVFDYNPILPHLRHCVNDVTSDTDSSVICRE